MFTEAERIRLCEVSGGTTKSMRRQPVTLMRKSRLLSNTILITVAAWHLPVGRLDILAVMYWLAGLMNFTPTDGVSSPVHSIIMPLWTRVETSGSHGSLYTTCTVSEIARNIGVSRTVLYKWKDVITGNEVYQTMRRHKAPSLEKECDVLSEDIARFNQEIHCQQMELDILEKAEEIIKKTQASASTP